MKLNLKSLIPIYTTVLALSGAIMIGGCGGSKATENSNDENIDQQIVNAASDASSKPSDAAVSETTDNAENMTASEESDNVSANQADEEIDQNLDAVISTMSMDEKISQLIIPAIRTWNDADVTDLSAVPELAGALRNHQYGGIILFAGNITGAEQATRLVYDLQKNNMQIEGTSAHIPYLMPVDEEGGKVIRLNTGTRMTGNMAIGATADATANAELTGMILGEELAAIGFNTDFAPVIDVNNNPANPVIGTRSFSDDPEIVASLGAAYSKGLSGSNIIATYKHFPGHGDTEVDSHIGTPSVEKSYEELLEKELVPFKKVIEDGADMIMTAHITYPLIDEEKTFGDGQTKGFFPATMSKKMITGILRTDLGYDGVVVTDALEMGAISTAGLVPGKENSAEYGVGIAAEVINAGVDMLLLPRDLTSPTAASYYDEYISGIAAKVESGEISEKRIDESVKRILKLKVKYEIYSPDGAQQEGVLIDERVAECKEIVGSKEHHEKEMELARQAITVVKNEDGTLPIKDDSKKTVIIGLQQGDAKAINFALDELSKSADINYFYSTSKADYVIAFSYASDSSVLDKNNPQFVALHKAIADTHKAGGKFILVSENLPYDAAVYQDADAIVLAYMGAGLNVDPTRDKESENGMSARNANIVAAIETIFGANTPKGHLPVNVPVVEESEDGTLKYGTEYLYERGFGLTY
ncbi:glycoside hydrolase family 3 protein [Butyrivibrio sp. VCB2001]|uniref:glycoside hydrolase family 3 protein n=1 Tax=Butyrivibrio sp. VCB2001 TaxID=1280667 RepID=UPI00041EA690|nr:glycoside hydrolase family 3 protein [Butyrivibrio sp. VCB2001]